MRYKCLISVDIILQNNNNVLIRCGAEKLIKLFNLKKISQSYLTHITFHHIIPGNYRKGRYQFKTKINTATKKQALKNKIKETLSVSLFENLNYQ